MPVSKTVRFEVFKRDLFSCQYCGRTPPTVILEVDHIFPVSAGGDDSPGNLLTACFDCNRGKGARSLGQTIKPLEESAEEMREREEQLKSYKSLLRKVKRREEEEINDVEKAFSDCYNGYSFTPQFRQSVRRFLRRIPVEYLVEYMREACSRGFERNHAVKYFCSIAWRNIREQEK